MKKEGKGFYKFFSFFSILTDKVLVAILTISLFMCLLNVSTGYQEVLTRQEHEMMKEQPMIEIQYYNEQPSNNEVMSEVSAAERFMQCLKNGPELDSIDSSIREKMVALDQLFQQNNQYFSFLYKDLYSGFTVSYNEKSPIFTASTIKAPAMIYLYEQASMGSIDLNEELVYTSNFYSGGSGVLKTKEVNTKYTVNQLIQYAIHDSDNIAYAMLMNRFHRENVLPFWSNLGTDYIFTLNTIWGVTSAHDASIYMQELYRFYLDNKEYGGVLMNYFKNAEWKMITDKNGNFNTANKGGWSGTAFHDVAIVFAENPYILVIMSNAGESNYSKLFQDTSKLVGELHEAYWKYKEVTCQNIKQY